MSSDDSIYDLIGMGFGPANLALACALSENRSSSPPRNVLFLERHENFQWHPGMLLPDARMQISFMKDLVTLRNPQSPFTFLSYLHAKHRLVSFINRGSTIPTRKEFADYLSWAAEQVEKRGVAVKYGEEVLSINEHTDGTVHMRSRNLLSGRITVRRCRNVVLSPGGSAYIPRVFERFGEDPFIIHSSTFCSSIIGALESLRLRNQPVSIAVVGCGQSAAEVTISLRERLSSFPVSGNKIDMIIRHGSLKPSDDSPFSNEIFDPESTDLWYHLASEISRKSVLAEYKSTNYGVVNPRTLDSLYEIIYDQKVDDGIRARVGAQDGSDTRINIIKYSDTIAVEAKGGQFECISRNVLSRAISAQKYDLIVCATGYKRTAWIDILKSSNLGARYGIRDPSLGVQLQPEVTRVADVNKLSELIQVAQNTNTSPSPSTSESTVSTPPTSPGCSPSRLNDFEPNKVTISRNYRLVPCESGCDIGPRVYLQGVEEVHGISETLLSVVGIRAGELVKDLY